MKFRLFGASTIIYLTKLLKYHDIKNFGAKTYAIVAINK